MSIENSRVRITVSRRKRWSSQDWRSRKFCYVFGENHLQGIIYYQLLPCYQTLNLDFNCQSTKSCQLWPMGFELCQNNASLHSLIVTRQMFRELIWEIFMQLPYRSDLEPYEYYLEKRLWRMICWGKIQLKRNLQKSTVPFFSNRDKEFYDVYLLSFFKLSNKVVHFSTKLDQSKLISKRRCLYHFIPCSGYKVNQQKIICPHRAPFVIKAHSSTIFITNLVLIYNHI